jgi:hypothetical protein
MRAKYLITEHPGAYLRGLGFLVPGQYFEAPDEKYVPARSFRALNEPAVAGLKVLKDAMLAKAKEYQQKAESNALTSGRREAFGDAAAHIEAEANAIELEIVGVPKEEVKVAPMVSLKAMDEAERGVKATPAATKRVADR